MADSFIRDLSETSTPLAFSRASMTELFYIEGKRLSKEAQVTLVQPESLIWLEKAISLLSSSRMQELIQEGKITLGAIKPRTEESKLEVGDDLEGERFLLSQIRDPLQRVFTVSLVPTSEDLGQFYPRDVQERMRSMNEGDKTVWEAFSSYISRGALTYFLLYDPSGNAVTQWRTQIGATNPAKASPDSLRGKFGRDIMRNLTHGSGGDTREEAIESVRSEVSWLVTMLSSLYKNINHNPSITMAKVKDLRLIPDDSSFVAASRMFAAYQAGGETYLEGFVLVHEGQKLEQSLLAVKDIITMGDIPIITRQYASRLVLLASQGVKVPHIYGFTRGEIFLDFVSGVKSASEALREIHSPTTPSEKVAKLVRQLAIAAGVLDKNGFIVIGEFYHNMMYDGHDLWFVDGGSDIGSANPLKQNNGSHQSLLSALRMPFLKEMAEQIYQQVRNT